MKMTSYKTIGIIGSRRRNTQQDYIETLTIFKSIYKNFDRIVSGGCQQGGDKFAERIAKSQQVPITIHYANWKRYGQQAGFVRNDDIAKDADVLIACVTKDRTGGTEDTIEKFKKLGKGRLYYV